MPKISIVTATYNRGDVLPRAIESIKGQTFRDYEHIIVDDGSTDDTKKVVSHVDDSRIKYVRLNTNMGCAAAFNKGVEEARGEYISFLDSDDEYLPQRLEITNKVLDQRSEKIGGVFHGLRIVGNNKKKSHFIEEKDFTVEDFREQNPICGTSNTMYRASVFDRVGGFDEQLMSTVDYDFQIRVAKKFNLVGINKLLCKRYDTVDGLQDDFEKVRQGISRFIDKHEQILSEKNLFDLKCKIGISHIALENKAKSRQLFNSILGNSSLYPAAHGRYIIGRKCFKSGYENEARYHLLKSIYKNPTNYKAHALVIFSTIPIAGGKKYKIIDNIYRYTTSN